VQRLHVLLERTLEAADVFAFPTLKQLLVRYEGDRSPPVLLLGDSVLERVSNTDQDARSLAEMLEQKLGGSTAALCISGSGYHMGVFEAFLRCLGKTRHRPALVVFPINLRSFSPQWDKDPRYQYDEEIRALERYIERGRRSTYLWRRSQDWAAYERTSVAYPASSERSVGDFLSVIRSRPLAENDRLQRRRTIFRFHYLHPLVDHHRRLRQLQGLVQRAIELGVSLVAFVPPINFQAGEELLGDAFRRAVSAQLGVVQQALGSVRTQGRLHLVEASSSLDRSHFLHDYEPTEHLNQKGREVLASLIANAVVADLRERGGAGTERLLPKTPKARGGSEPGAS
jgi:hypothetical protein